MEHLSYYEQLSGQQVNWDKSHLVFGSSVTSSRCLKISHKVGMKIDDLPFSYLKARLFKGSPTVQFIQPIVDKITSTLESQEGASLSYVGLICLVNFVITSPFVHFFIVYKWLIAMLKLSNALIWSFV